MKIKSLFLSFCFYASVWATPFQHELDVRMAPGVGAPTLCMHGYGDSGKNLLNALTRHKATQMPLITFNFPNYDIRHHPFIAEKTCFGTIQELLPPLYLMKKMVIDEGNSAINLYGFSAGGGAVVNCLAVLNSNRFESELNTIGIGARERESILRAVQNGKVLLDVPLKSMEEIIEYRGGTEEFLIVGKRYRDNDLRPIDNLKGLSGLALDVALFFQSPDKTIANRDDELYIETLKKANALGRTRVLVADEGGHATFHRFPWEE